MWNHLKFRELHSFNRFALHLPNVTTGAGKFYYNKTYCWLETWSLLDLNATSNEVAVETLEIAYEGINVDKWS